MTGTLNALARDEDRARQRTDPPKDKSRTVAHSDVLEASERVPSLLRIRTAVATTWDKTGLIDLAIELNRFGVEFIATEGTAACLRDDVEGLKLTDLSAYTGYPENLNGRLKTLHPKIQAGVLAIKGHHDATLAKEDVAAKYIDLVIVNLYPFEQTVGKGATFFECIENIDIGGPALLRAAAKNHVCVTAVCDPKDYSKLIDELRRNDGCTSLEFRRRCAEKVFRTTMRYDRTIASWFKSNKDSR
jgi:phosphoribosylaminoimidazolecarboxamide formyltransferase/IMP cyclohydrolase